MDRRALILLISSLIFNIAGVTGQQVRVVFYNVENLFDTSDDSLTNDAEFLPQGDKNWTYDRFHRKIVRVYQVMAAIGKGEMPAIIGLCEIENRGVLNRLVYDTPMKKSGFRVIHRESQDARGVDVALLYRPEIFSPDTSEWLKVPLGERETTREILHVVGRLWENDTVHFYINHWPSRYGGAGSSATKRLAAASILAASVKEVLLSNINSNIIIMGDFNDEPGDESILAINKILVNNSDNERFHLNNLSDKRATGKVPGTIKHQGTWSVFDQLIVSTAISDGVNGIRIFSNKAEIFDADFLLEPDETYSGSKPFRTYTGPGYHNGFSDHLPVSILIGK